MELVYWLQIDFPPHLIMSEVLKVLQNLEVTWKIVGAYYAKCKWMPPPPRVTNCFDPAVAAGKLRQSSSLAFGSNKNSLHENRGDTAAVLQSPIKFEAQVTLSLPQFSLLCKCLLLSSATGITLTHGRLALDHYPLIAALHITVGKEQALGS